MKILYDYQCFAAEVSGASRAFCEVANILRKQNEVEIYAPFSRNIYIEKLFGKRTPLKFMNNKLIRYAEYHSSRYMSRIHVAKNNFDLFHPTNDSYIYYKDVIKRPFVITIHDMIPEKLYKNSSRLPNREWLVENATRIVCVSKNTKNELLEYYTQIDPGKVDVVYHGIDQGVTDYKENVWGGYFLYVGERLERKNFLFMVDSLLPLLHKNKELKIICTGRGFNDYEKKLFVDKKIENQIVSVGFVDDQELFSLYKNALLFIFPSLYEGFGIPILEAFTNNCPVCLANATCFPEIGGDAVAYFDPHDKDSILYTVTEVMEQPNLANELRKKGKERAKLFTWEKSATAMLDSYQKALK